MKHLIAVIVMTAHLTACTSWRVQELAPQQAAQLRITLADGTRMVVSDPQVVGDSLVGFRPAEPFGRERVAFPKGDVQRIEARKPDPPKTVAALIALGGAIGAIIFLIKLYETPPGS